MNNLNLIFNKTYYKSLGTSGFEKDVKEKNKMIFASEFDNKSDYRKSPVASNVFLLKTTYPGLLIGTGNPHGSKQSTEDINIGFSFDYVTGQPFIPGSSVKGLLRSCFIHKEAIAEILQSLNGDNWETDEICLLEKEIFDGTDVFFDAVVYDGNEARLIMGSDYITPHTEQTKNPIPIFLIKVLPEVRFEFRFLIKSEKLNGKLTVSQQESLFKELLMIFGIGAKTNIGYGSLTECDNVITEKKAIHNINAVSFGTQNHMGKPEFKVCTVCGKRSYKYNKNDSSKVNWNWDKNICWDKNCRGALK